MGYSKEELEDKMREWYSVNQRRPRIKDFDKDTSTPSSTTYLRKYNTSWTDLVDQILGSPVKKQYPVDEAFNTLLIKFRNDYLRIVPDTVSEFNTNRTPDTPSTLYYRNNYGLTWYELKKLAGVTNVRHSKNTYGKRRVNPLFELSNAECIDMFKKECSRIEAHTVYEFDSYKDPKIPSVKFFQKRLGLSWAELREMAGVPKRLPHSVAKPNRKISINVVKPNRKVRSYYLTDEEFEIINEVLNTMRKYHPVEKHLKREKRIVLEAQENLNKKTKPRR